MDLGSQPQEHLEGFLQMESVEAIDGTVAVHPGEVVVVESGWE